MSTAETAEVLGAELDSLFSGLEKFPVLALAVSGGPDSTALMLLAARWRDARGKAPKLIALTVDHGLRQESKREAAAVAKLARKLKIAHRTLRWTGRKPKTGLQQAARAARYRLLAQAARTAHAAHILTAHTLDDQAETVLLRMSRGSGLTGLGAMARQSPVPGAEKLMLVRPLLGLPKVRLIATLEAAKIPCADDPSNRDPRFTRARLRGLAPILAEEGLSAARLALLARRLKRADAALEMATDQAASAFLHLSQSKSDLSDFDHLECPNSGKPEFGWERSTREARRVRGCKVESYEPPHPSPLPTGEREPAVPSGLAALTIEAADFAALPDEIALRLLGRAIASVGTEGPVELAKLEALQEALDTARKSGSARFRRSLAGAIVTLSAGKLTVEPAPPRRGKALTKPLTKALTKARRRPAKARKAR